VEKSPSSCGQNLTSNSGPLGPVLPGAILPAVTFWLFGSWAAVHVRSSRRLGTVGQVCCGSRSGFCPAVWELALWLMDPSLSRLFIYLYLHSCLNFSLPWYKDTQLSCINVWIFAYMHAFENLRMLCVNWPGYLYENGAQWWWALLKDLPLCSINRASCGIKFDLDPVLCCHYATIPCLWFSA